VPTIVTDVATFADYPGDVVRKVRWESEGPDGLRRALFELAQSPEARATLGRSAWEYVKRHHEWTVVARQYVDVIERCHRERVARASSCERSGLRVSSRALAS
jgi:glycosyltransferase involved in cell wall biosynthesis